MSTTSNSQRGSVALFTLIALNLALAGVLGWQIWHKMRPTPTPVKSSNSQTTSNTSTNTSSNSPASSSNSSSIGMLQLNSQNVERKDDASTLMATVMEYANNNNGSMPTAISGGQIQGSGTSDYPSTVPSFSYYKTATLQTGAKAALMQDELVVVTQATCNQDGSTSSGTSRDVVIQYSVKQSDGTFKGACDSQ